MKLTIIIINFKTKKYLESCLSSIFAQTTKHSFEVILIDNDSEDLADIKKLFPKIILLTNTVNVGFASGMNQGICMSEAEYVLTLNPDVVLEKDYIEKCINELDKNDTLSSVTGKLLYYDFSKKKKTNIIDSTGLVMKKNRHALDRGQGEKDVAQYDDSKIIWGASAAAAIYRKSSLESVKDKHGYFDSRFFMYKEDVDLAWRLYNKKLKCMLIPKALAYHRRGTGIVDPSLSFFKKLKQRKSNKSKDMRRLSFKNQRLMEKKNDTILHKLQDSYILYPYKLLRLIYIILFEPNLLK